MKDPLTPEAGNLTSKPQWWRNLLAAAGMIGGFCAGGYWAAKVLGPLLDRWNIPSELGMLAQLAFPFGLALALGGWTWHWRRFPLGRVLGFLLMVPGLWIWGAHKMPTPHIVAPDVRGELSHFDPSKLHIDGVVPGMTQAQVVALLGEPSERRRVTRKQFWGAVQVQTFVYPDKNLEIIYQENNTVGAVRGPALQEKGGDLISAGQSLAKIEGQFGLPREMDSKDGRYAYSFWHPSFTVFYKDSKVIAISLYDGTSYDDFFETDSPKDQPAP